MPAKFAFEMPVAALSREQEAIEHYQDSRTDAAFEALFRALCPRLLLYFTVRGCDAGVAEDLTQNVMLNVYRHSGMVRDRSLFRAWVLRIAHNELVQHWKRLGRQVQTIDLDSCTAALLERAATHPGGCAVEFAEAMEQLLPQERQVILLRYVEQLEYREIAAVLEVPIGTVQWRAFVARRKMAGYFRRRVV